ncbi:MAG: NifU family protein [Verrucomicrobiota bacterium]|nr:NifU family protein [Verrucomicrobiota bacterium]
MDKPQDRAFQGRLTRIEELIKGVEAIADEKARTQACELVAALMELQGAGFERTLELIYDSGPGGQVLIDELGRDALVSSLLLVHGLHPLDLETRVRRALEEVRPKLGQHGGSVQLIGVTPEGAVRLQLEGNCEGCPSSRLTLKFSIEEALYAAAPDITALEVNGLVEEHAPAAPNPMFTECPTTNGNGQQQQVNEAKL